MFGEDWLRLNVVAWASANYSRCRTMDESLAVDAPNAIKREGDEVMLKLIALARCPDSVVR
jgi:hypothetical protein